MKKWYIKERHNPQLGIYYCLLNQLTKKEAKEYEKSIYGDNYILSFDTKEEYENKIKELEKNKEKIYKY